MEIGHIFLTKKNIKQPSPHLRSRRDPGAALCGWHLSAPARWRDPALGRAAATQELTPTASVGILPLVFDVQSLLIWISNNSENSSLTQNTDYYYDY